MKKQYSFLLIALSLLSAQANACPPGYFLAEGTCHKYNNEGNSSAAGAASVSHVWTAAEKSKKAVDESTAVIKKLGAIQNSEDLVKQLKSIASSSNGDILMTKDAYQKALAIAKNAELPPVPKASFTSDGDVKISKKDFQAYVAKLK